MKEDISIAKLNISNLHKTVIPWIKPHRNTQKSLIHILLIIILINSSQTTIEENTKNFENRLIQRGYPVLIESTSLS